jgi:hypothetical protein
VEPSVVDPPAADPVNPPAADSAADPGGTTVQG